MTVVNSIKNKDIEVNLKEDKSWKKIQQNTFTRWVNQHLKKVDTSIQDLESDFFDGIKLIKLAEVLSNKKILRYNKKPTVRNQMLDNISQALNFFQEHEGIKLVNIDSSDIADKNLKLILGLIWTLIMHYSISKSINLNNENSSDEKKTLKQKLLAWIKSRLPPDVPVTNFTSDWNDGIALGALVEAILPNSCSDWRSWDPKNAFENTKKSMEVARIYLGIYGLLTPEELINPNVDEKSIMTYFSQFPQARLQNLCNLVNVEENPIVNCKTQFQIDLLHPQLELFVEILDCLGNLIDVKIDQDSKTRFTVTYEPKYVGIHKIVVTGKNNKNLKVAEATVNVISAPKIIGLCEEIEIGEEKKFRIVDVSEDSQLDVIVVNPNGDNYEIEISERVGNSLVCLFCSSMIGLHSLNVFLNQKHIPGSPFPIRVLNKTIDKANVWGRGIFSEGACANEELLINVDGAQQLVNVLVQTNDGIFLPVQQKFSYLNSSSLNSSQNRNHRLIEKYKRQIFSYLPRSAGTYKIEIISANGQHLGKSPYIVEIGSKNLSKVSAVGPGIESGIKNKKSFFYINAFNDANSLNFSIEGPNKTQFSCTDYGDSTVSINYTPISSGIYKINILNDNKHIKNSPFNLFVESDDEENNNDQQSIKITGLDKETKHFAKSTLQFSINNSNVDVLIYDPDLIKCEFTKHLSQKNDETLYSFVPEKPGKYLISLSKNGVALDDWPFFVNVEEAKGSTKMGVYGDGVSSRNIFVNEPTNFTIDLQNLNSNKVNVKISDPNDEILKTIEIDNKSDLPNKNISYVPLMPGPHKIEVFDKDNKVFDVKVNVEDRNNFDSEFLNEKSESENQNKLHKTYDFNEIDKVSSYNDNDNNNDKIYKKNNDFDSSLEQKTATEIAKKNVEYNYSFYFKHLTNSSVEPNLTAHISSPDGNTKPVLIEPLSERNQYRVDFIPEVKGLNKIFVYDDKKEIEGSPFRVNVETLDDKKTQVATNTDSQQFCSYVNKKEKFYVTIPSYMITKSDGEVSLKVIGPSRADAHLICENNKDSICNDTSSSDIQCCVEYCVSEPGLYDFNICYNDEPISSLSYKVFVQQNDSETKDENSKQIIESNSYQYTTYSRHINYEKYKQNDTKIQKIINDSKYSFNNISSHDIQHVHVNHDNYFDFENEKHRHNESFPVIKFNCDKDVEDNLHQISARGTGLNSFNIGEIASFVVDTSLFNNGTRLLFVSLVTLHGESDDVFVQHVGNGIYKIDYRICSESPKAVITIKYGDHHIPGSPFVVYPNKH